MKALLFAAGLISFVLYRAEKLGPNLHGNQKGPYKSNEKIFEGKKTPDLKNSASLYTNYLLTANYSPFLHANDTTN